MERAWRWSLISQHDFIRRHQAITINYQKACLHRDFSLAIPYALHLIVFPFPTVSHLVNDHPDHCDYHSHLLPLLIIEFQRWFELQLVYRSTEKMNIVQVWMMRGKKQSFYMCGSGIWKPSEIHLSPSTAKTLYPIRQRPTFMCHGLKGPPYATGSGPGEALRTFRPERFRYVLCNDRGH